MNHSNPKAVISVTHQNVFATIFYYNGQYYFDINGDWYDRLEPCIKDCEEFVKRKYNGSLQPTARELYNERYEKAIFNCN